MNEPYLIELDTRLVKNCPAMEFVKGDIGANSIHITLTENNVPILLTGKTVTVTIKKPDTTIIVYDVAVIDNDIIDFILDANALAITGTTLATVEVYQGVIRQTVKKFQYKVIDSLNASDNVASFSDYPILTKLIGDVQDVIGAENTRTNNETTRIAAEDIRIVNENARISDVNNIKTAYEEATKDNLNLEVSNSRKDNINNVNYENLGDRLDATSSQLAEKTQQINAISSQTYITEKAKQADLNATNVNVNTNKTDITNLKSNKADTVYVDTKVASLVSGSPDKTYATLADLNTAYPTGDSKNKLVAANGHIYNWNGTVWADTGIQYQSTGIAKGSITPTQLSFLPIAGVPSKNLFNKDYTIPGAYVNYADGTFHAQTGQNRTFYIPIPANTVFSVSGTIQQCAFYNSSQVFISGLSSTGVNKTTPPNTAYMVQTFLDADFNIQIELGSTATAYTSFILSKDIRSYDDDIYNGMINSISKNIYVANHGEVTIESENPLSHGYVFIHLGDMRIINGSNITISWATLKTQINDESKFATSSKGILDCLRLNTGDYFIYNFITNKCEIVSICPKNYILLAHNPNGYVCDGVLAKLKTERYLNKTDSIDTRVTNIESANALPDYVSVELGITNATVADLGSPNKLCFGMITDTHYYKESLLPLNHITNICANSKYKLMDFIVHGGDITIGSQATPITKSTLSDIAKYASDSKVPFYFLRGNHDDNAYYANTTKQISDVITNDQWYSRMIKPALKNMQVDSNNPAGGYFYQDFKQQKVRVIMLNTNDFPIIANADGSPKYLSVYQYAIRDTQLNWLAHTALNFDDKGTDKSNWGVIIVAHVPPRASLSFANDGQMNNGLALESIIRAFKAGRAYTSVGTDGDLAYNINVDYSSQGAMDVIAYFYGHTHYDDVIVPADGEGITYITVNCSLCLQSTGIPTGATCQTRTSGTATEDSWEVFTIDRANRTIYGTKFGAGENRVITY